MAPTVGTTSGKWRNERGNHDAGHPLKAQRNPIPARAENDFTPMINTPMARSFFIQQESILKLLNRFNKRDRRQDKFRNPAPAIGEHRGVTERDSVRGQVPAALVGLHVDRTVFRPVQPSSPLRIRRSSAGATRRMFVDPVVLKGIPAVTTIRSSLSAKPPSRAARAAFTTACLKR